MILPDVNVLLNAFRKDSPDHARCQEWLNGVASGPAAFGMSTQILSSVVRIATHPNIYKRPDPATAVLEFCDEILSIPECHLVSPGARHWRIFRELRTATNARGNLVQDAWFAALAIEHGCEWVTLDKDYAKFPNLRWRRPF